MDIGHALLFLHIMGAAGWISLEPVVRVPRSGRSPAIVAGEIGVTIPTQFQVAKKPPVKRHSGYHSRTASAISAGTSDWMKCPAPSRTCVVCCGKSV